MCLVKPFAVKSHALVKAKVLSYKDKYNCGPRQATQMASFPLKPGLFSLHVRHKAFVWLLMRSWC